jgi:hypothetical protein
MPPFFRRLRALGGLQLFGLLCVAMAGASPGYFWAPAATLVAVQAGPILGNYPDTSITLSNDTTVTPDAAPTNTTSTTVSTSTNFKGKLEGNPTTGVLRITDAHPAGTYTVTVKASNGGGLTATKTFTLIVGTPATCTPVSFAVATDFGAGTYPDSVAVGDFNGDGRQDLVVANFGSNNVSILLGDGAGNFSVPTTFGAGREPISVAVGDFNGDGKQDLAVANFFFTMNVSILLGDGTGHFSAATTFSAGRDAYSVAVGDFNGDGKQDLAVANNGSNDISILLGDGEGNFSAPLNFDVGGVPYSVAVGDFNGDGRQDLAVANEMSNDVSILLGDGAGNFNAPANFAVGSSPHAVALGDFNDDGIQDLAVTTFNSNNVSILLGDGTGNFSAARGFGVGINPYSVAVGDFNGDGKQDLAVANEFANNISILLGDGAGSFSAPTNFGVGSEPIFIAVGDFNGDGKQDLAVANIFSNNVSILLRDCGPGPTPSAKLLNLSTRLLVQTGSNVGIAGFIITGSGPRRFLLRGIGPSLTDFGIAGTLGDPTIELRASDGSLVRANDNWRDTQEAEIQATGIPPTNDLESAVVAMVDPGQYTAILRGKNNGVGVALVEVYDLDQLATSQLANLSTRAFVGTADNVAIAGFILGGGGHTNVVIRAVTPSFGILNPLVDPTLELRDLNGALIAANDNCGTLAPFPSYSGTDGPLPTTACPPFLCSSGSLDACINISLPPGAFTAILAGKNGHTGIGLIEIYNLQ